MPWIKFVADFDWKMNPRALTAYKAGMRCLVSQACADAAINADKAVESSNESGVTTAVPPRNRSDAGR